MKTGETVRAARKNLVDVTDQEPGPACSHCGRTGIEGIGIYACDVPGLQGIWCLSCLEAAENDLPIPEWGLADEYETGQQPDEP